MTVRLPTRFLPLRIQQSLYHRYFHARHAKWPDLFRTAPLRLCPEMSMHDLVQQDIISGNIAFNGFYELQLSRLICSEAKGGGLFVDVGANMGYFTLLWTGCGSGNVIAVEAAPRNIALLRQNVERNNVASRVRVLACAASNVNGTVNFKLGPSDQTGWGGISNQSGSEAFTVPSIRLDEELPGRQISVLKVDVEGADALVLYGCEALLRSRLIRRIYFEQNYTRMAELGIRAGEVQKFLRDVGYEAHPLAVDETEWVSFPQTTGNAQSST